MNRPNRFNAAYAPSFVGFDFGDRRRICSRKPAQVRFYAGMFILWPSWPHPGGAGFSVDQLDLASDDSCVD